LHQAEELGKSLVRANAEKENAEKRTLRLEKEAKANADKVSLWNVLRISFECFSCAIQVSKLELELKKLKEAQKSAEKKKEVCARRFVLNFLCTHVHHSGTRKEIV
jgi:hypothetical protein